MSKIPTGKIAYLEGVRGFAALMVLFHHFGIAFYPAHYDGGAHYDGFVGWAHTDGLEIKWFESPLSFLTNGNFAVAIFYILSGFVLSHKYYQENNPMIMVSAAQRRFLRLFIPVAFTIILSWILLKAGAYNHIEASKISLSDWWLAGLWKVDTDLLTLIQHLGYKVMFMSDSSFDTSMWTMTTELFGSIFVFAFLALSHNVRRKGFLLLCMFYFYFITGQYYFCAFVLGIVLNYIHKDAMRPGSAMARNVLMIGFLIVGLLLGSYPSSGIVRGTFFKFTEDTMLVTQYQIIHVIGAFLLIVSFIYSPLLQKIFSNKFFTFLGFISFSLYLLHPLVIGAFSCNLFMEWHPTMGYNKATLIIFMLTVLLTVGLSWVMAKYVDRFSLDFSKKYYLKFIQEVADKKSVKK